MTSSGDRIATGTGASRRRLTLEEAEAGGLPEPMTREEWDEMHRYSRAYHNQLIADGCDSVPSVRPRYIIPHVRDAQSITEGGAMLDTTRYGVRG